MDPREVVAARYRSFAVHEAAATSPTLHDWALAVANDEDLIALIGTLPPGKQQPNLVFAAARVHGALPGNVASLRGTLVSSWSQVQETIGSRSTQTNEAARCASLLVGLRSIPGPLALLEVGASAGLCLVPDRYSYVFNGETRLDPAAGPSDLTIPISLAGGLVPPTAMPDIAWRAGLDLNPLDPGDADTLEWLEALVWPEHEDRRQRLVAAARITAREQLDIRRANLIDGVSALAAEAPAGATLVIAHSATLAYLDAEQRHQALDVFASTGAHRYSFEGRGVDPTVPPLDTPRTHDTLFVASLDGAPYCLADGHGNVLTKPPRKLR